MIHFDLEFFWFIRENNVLISFPQLSDKSFNSL